MAVRFRLEPHKLMIAGGAVFASDAVPLQSRVIDY